MKGVSRIHQRMHNFSVERMAAGGARLQIRASVARRHRSRQRSAQLSPLWPLPKPALTWAFPSTNSIASSTSASNPFPMATPATSPPPSTTWAISILAQTTTLVGTRSTASPLFPRLPLSHREATLHHPLFLPHHHRKILSRIFPISSSAPSTSFLQRPPLSHRRVTLLHQLLSTPHSPRTLSLISAHPWKRARPKNAKSFVY